MDAHKHLHDHLNSTGMNIDMTPGQSVDDYTSKGKVGAYDRVLDADTFSAFEAMVKQGDPAAQFNLGVAYTKGIYVAQDYTQAIDWYRKASEQGFAKA